MASEKKKKVVDLRMQELRRILMGLYYVDETGMVRVSDRVYRVQGMLNGADTILTRGLYVEELQRPITGNLQDLLKECVIALENTGKPVRLEASPHTVAVLHFSILLNPSILTIAKRDDTLRISFYTAKTLTAKLNAKRTLQKLLEQLPAGEYSRCAPEEPEKE